MLAPGATNAPETDGATLARIRELETENRALRERVGQPGDLRERAELYRSLVDQAGVVLWEYSFPEQRFLYVSPHAERMLGYRLATWLEPNFWAAHVHPDDLDAAAWFCASAAQRGEDHVLEYRMRHADGRIIHIRDIVTVVREARPLGSVLRGALVDVTELSAAETARRASEERFRTLFERLDVGVVLQGPDANVLMANPAASRLLGLTHEQLIGVSPADPRWAAIDVHGKPMTGADHPVSIALRTRQPVRDAIFEVSRGDGARIWLQVNSEPALGPDGRVRDVLTTFSDISGQRRTAELLRQTGARYLGLIERIPVMVYECPPHRIGASYISPRIQELLGWSPEEWLATPDAFEQCLHPEDRDAVLAEHDRVCASGTHFSMEYRLIRRDGRVIWIRDDAVFLRDASGLLLRREGVVQDITLRKLAQDELTRYRDHLEQMIAKRTAELMESQERVRRGERLSSIGTLAAGIAHELNNPLGLILFAVESLREAAGDPAAVARSAEEIGDHARRCARIVRGVLQFARDDLPEREPVSLNQTIARARDLARLAADRAQVKIGLAASADAPMVSGSPTDLDQLVLNLTLNAVQACRPGGVVTLATERRADEVCVAVRDNGRGMSPEQVKHAFDPFYTSRQGEGGTGLGLSTCHGIAKAHGARIDVESAVGQGSCFVVTFPRAAPAAGCDRE